MRIQDLGQLSGEILVFGGVYSNLAALEALIEVAVQRGIPPVNMICSGDVVAYCAEAEECAQLIRGLGCPVLSGNCEVQLSKDADDCGCGYEPGSVCSLLSRDWFAHAKNSLSPASKRWMGQLPDRIVFENGGQRFVVVHGTATDIAGFLWPSSSDLEVDHQFNVLESQVGPFDCVIAGHSGIPTAASTTQGQWYNPGAVGMPPHDGDPRGCYGLLSDGAVTFHRLSYDTKRTIIAMQTAGLTQGYNRALQTGYMPSEDTFPPELRRTSIL